jgi:hypothetical protein
MNIYWMVHRPNGGGPVVKHDTKAEAAAEARRLAGQHPGEVYTVLEVIEAFISPVKPVEALMLEYAEIMEDRNAH